MKKKFTTITSQKIFKEVYSSKKAVSNSVVLFFSDNHKNFNIAFVASKKVGKAVQRNKAKRIMRSASREIYNLYPATGSAILLARRNILTIPFSKILQDIKFCLKKVNS